MLALFAFLVSASQDYIDTTKVAEEVAYKNAEPLVLRTDGGLHLPSIRNANLEGDFRKL